MGILDVHSDQPNAFSQDDITIMQTMADQIATAIERTRLLDEVERNLKELETAYGQYTSEGWQKLEASGRIRNIGYRYNNVNIEPIAAPSALGDEAMATANVVYSKNQKSGNDVAIPIKLRGKVIGVVTARLKEGHSQITVSALESASDRLAAALESARLYEDARARADREQAISQVTSRISAATEFDAILRTTVEEIGKSLGNSEVSVQIISPEDQLSDQ
jgi:GAF domain-containing protein